MENEEKNPAQQAGKFGPDVSDTDTATNLLAWTLNPYPKVGNTETPLSSCPATIDIASFPGCKGQSFTTFNCATRSIIVGACYHDIKYKQNESNNKAADNCDHTTRFVTEPSKILKLYIPASNKENVRIQQGGYIFDKSTGDLLKPKEYKTLLSHLESVNIVNSSTKEEKRSDSSAVSESSSTTTSTPSITSFEIGAAMVDAATDNPAASNSKSCGTVVSNTDNDCINDDGSDGAKENVGTFLYADTVPVRVTTVSNWRRRDDFNQLPPLTPFFNAINEKLVENAPSTALMSVVRGPTIRDATAIAGLAKSLKHNSGSFKDVAPIVRLLCIGCSLDQWAYGIDPIMYKLIRRAIPDGQVTMKIVTPTWAKPDSMIYAVPLDVAVSIGLNKFNNDMPEPFKYGTMDSDWTMVPIRQAALNNGWASYYITAFLDSAFWNGTVNWRVNTTWQDANWRDYKKGTQNFMPNCNSVRIPGAKHILLVLLDCSTGSCPTTVNIVSNGHNIDVPVWWPGRQNPPNSADWRAHWNALWVDNNKNNIPYHVSAAYNEMCTMLGVADTCGQAISIAAELYLGSHPGVAVSVSEGTHNYSTDPADGSYAFGGGFINKRQGTIKAEAWPEIPDTTQIRAKLVGFNFGVQTPYHIIPTGAATTVRASHWHDVDDGRQYVEYQDVTWSTNGRDVPIGVQFAAYTIYGVSSIMRLSIATGLVETASQHYRFASGAGMSNFINMQACALGLSTQLFLSANDIEARTWSGWNGALGRTHISSVYQRLKSDVTDGILNHVSADMLVTYPGIWAWDSIDEYYDMDPKTSLDWATNSNWPIHAYQQWMKKLSLAGSGKTATKLESFITQEGLFKLGAKLNTDMKQQAPFLFSTIDFDRYAPVEYVNIPGNAPFFSKMWLDDFSYTSSGRLSALGDRQFFTSTVSIRSLQQKHLLTAMDSVYYVLDCRYTANGSEDQTLRTTDLSYPDPPSYSDFLGAVTDYIIFPAASALAAFVTTGSPIAAAAAAAGSAIHSAQADVMKAKIERAATEKQGVPQKIEIVENSPTLKNREPQTGVESSQTTAEN